MSNEHYEIMSYDEEDRWYATVLHVVNGEPIFVYRVPSDPPTYLEPINEPELLKKGEYDKR